jgi:hypothetical protein
MTGMLEEERPVLVHPARFSCLTVRIVLDMSWLGSSGVAPQSAIDQREIRQRLADRLPG